MRSGVGSYVWPNGARYHGEWRNGTMHGVGMLQAQNGASYEVAAWLLQEALRVLMTMQAASGASCEAACSVA